ncbi:MAG: hypothetical protein F2662_03810 [Actinobacteria bacterium]|uniref:Unannotated protein n=1 Tax=freshwater metagenome TaxID=449393 RepID=A0A6J6NY81_9ZZZZ|nr:hypothetical protein [Actinomycetota bacterium]
MKLGQLTRVGTLLLLSTLLVTGCSNSPSNQQSRKTPEPSSTETEDQKPLYPLGLDYGGKILLAKDDLELEFLTIAIASCKKAQTDGLIITDSENTTYFRPKANDENSDWPFDQVTVDKGKVTEGKFNIYLPAFFDPCDLEIQAHRAEAEAPVLEHKVERWATNSYGWSQHHFGAVLEEIVYQVSNGLITRYGAYNDLNEVVSYGPFTPEQSAYFDRVNE